MTRSSETSGNGARLTNEELFEALGSQMRRIVLFHLRQQGAATFDTLVDVVCEYTDTRGDVGADDPARVAMGLNQHHLPCLEELDLVAYDRLHDVVELTDPPADFGDWVDLVIRRDLWCAARHDWAEQNERDGDGTRDLGDTF